MFGSRPFLNESQWHTIKAYQSYGYAMAQAQVLENTIVSCVASLRILGQGYSSSEQVQEQIVLDERSVMDAFVRYLDGREDLSRDIRINFLNVCNRRNYLAHYFFLYTTQQWSTSGDLVDLATELASDAVQFEDMVNCLTTIVCPGIQPEFVADPRMNK